MPHLFLMRVFIITLTIVKMTAFRGVDDKLRKHQIILSYNVGIALRGVRRLRTINPPRAGVISTYLWKCDLRKLFLQNAINTCISLVVVINIRWHKYCTSSKSSISQIAGSWFIKVRKKRNTYRFIMFIISWEPLILNRQLRVWLAHRGFRFRTTTEKV